MHVRQQGSVLVLIRTVYDPVRKRGVQSTLARIPAYTRPDTVPAEVRSQLTTEESSQLDDYLKARADGERLESQKRSLDAVAFFLAQAAGALESGMQPADPAAVWDALASFQKSLKRAGFPKPTRAADKEAA